MQLEPVSVETQGFSRQEEVAYGRMKTFCSNIIKRLAPPIQKEARP